MFVSAEKNSSERDSNDIVAHSYNVDDFQNYIVITVGPYVSLTADDNTRCVPNRVLAHYDVFTYK